MRDSEVFDRSASAPQSQFEAHSDLDESKPILRIKPERDKLIQQLARVILEVTANVAIVLFVRQGGVIVGLAEPGHHDGKRIARLQSERLFNEDAFGRGIELESSLPRSRRTLSKADRCQQQQQGYESFHKGRSERGNRGGGEARSPLLRDEVELQALQLVLQNASPELRFRVARIFPAVDARGTLRNFEEAGFREGISEETRLFNVNPLARAVTPPLASLFVHTVNALGDVADGQGLVLVG